MVKDINLEDKFADGQFKFMDEDYEGSIAIFSEILEIDPNFSKAYQARAIAKFKIGNVQEALKDLDEAIKCEPDNPKFYYHKSAILFKENLLDEAVEMVSRAIDLDPTFASAYYLRSQLLEKLGEEEAAALDMNQAMALRREQAKAAKYIDF